jgi:hypothetical protein
MAIKCTKWPQYIPNVCTKEGGVVFVKTDEFIHTFYDEDKQFLQIHMYHRGSVFCIRFGMKDFQ